MNDIKKIGIVGAGIMGRGIAQKAVMVGYEVCICDLSQEILDDGLSTIKKQLNKGVEKGKWDADYVANTLAKITGLTELTALSDCDLIIECVTENKTIKFEVFEQLDKVARPETILASNTSSISITELASRTENPQRVIGMHFFNPVFLMELIEIIPGLKTDKQVVEATVEVSSKMEKTAVKVSDSPGFIVNRLMIPMINEAIYAVHEGVAEVEDIDNAMKLGASHPMGPLELADYIGLDTCLAIMNVLHNELGDSKYRPCPLLNKYVAANLLGRKTKRGFYDYGNV